MFSNLSSFCCDSNVLGSQQANYSLAKKKDENKNDLIFPIQLS